MNNIFVTGRLVLCAVVLLLAGCARNEAPPAPAESGEPAEAVQPQAGEELRAELTGAAEVPGPGDPEGSGTAVVELRPDVGQVCFDITVENIAEPTAAHIHSGAPDAAGPPVVNFEIPDQGLSSCVDADVETIRNIQSSPGDFYVNVHTADYPPGAIRGQLTR